MLQTIINGVAVGFGISILALGFQLVYRASGVFHIAAGAVYASVPYIFSSILGLGLPVWFSLVVSLSAGILLSCAVEYFNHRKLGMGDRNLNAHLLSSLGLYIIFVQVVIMIWGPNVRSLRGEQDIAIRVADGLTITRAQIYALTIQPALLLSFLLLLRASNIGLKLRALMQNSSEIPLLGYSIPRLRLLAFAFSGFFVASAALVNAYDLGYDAQGGLTAILLAVAALIIGGRDTYWGPIVGGLLLGVLRSLSVWFSPKWQDSITFTLLVVFLFLAPRGLLGLKPRWGMK
jgi:branched-chain amino acid transport system permease protein